MLHLRPDHRYRLYQFLLILDIACIGYICALLLQVAFGAPLNK